MEAVPTPITIQNTPAQQNGSGYAPKVTAFEVMQQQAQVQLWGQV